MNAYTLSAKTSMEHLLLKETFDPFLFIEGEITTFNTFSINGLIEKDFFDEPPAGRYSDWRSIRPYCFHIIRGKRTPLRFKLVLSLSPEHYVDFLTQEPRISCRPEEIRGLYLNFRFDGSTLQCITGTSQLTFSLDKSLEEKWDEYVYHLLKEMGSDPLPGTCGFP